MIRTFSEVVKLANKRYQGVSVALHLRAKKAVDGLSDDEVEAVFHQAWSLPARNFFVTDAWARLFGDPNSRRLAHDLSSGDGTFEESWNAVMAAMQTRFKRQVICEAIKQHRGEPVRAQP